MSRSFIILACNMNRHISCGSVPLINRHEMKHIFQVGRCKDSTVHIIYT